LNLVEEDRDIVIQAQCGSHTSKHIMNDDLMSGWRVIPERLAAQTSTPRGTPHRSTPPV
jgi:hypothetical protein